MKTYVFLNATTGEVIGTHTCSERGADDWVLYYIRQHRESICAQPADEFYVHLMPDLLAA